MQSKVIVGSHFHIPLIRKLSSWFLALQNRTSGSTMQQGNRWNTGHPDWTELAAFRFPKPPPKISIGRQGDRVSVALRVSIAEDQTS